MLQPVLGGVDADADADADAVIENSTREASGWLAEGADGMCVAGPASQALPLDSTRLTMGVRRRSSVSLRADLHACLPACLPAFLFTPACEERSVAQRDRCLCLFVSVCVSRRSRGSPVLVRDPSPAAAVGWRAEGAPGRVERGRERTSEQERPRWVDEKGEHASPAVPPQFFWPRGSGHSCSAVREGDVRGARAGAGGSPFSGALASEGGERLGRCRDRLRCSSGRRCKCW